jgi:hypothetical protein
MKVLKRFIVCWRLIFIGFVVYGQGNSAVPNKGAWQTGVFPLKSGQR